MNYIGKFISNFKDAYNEINGATLTGAIDAVVVRQEDGSFVCSPFHVRFGKIGVLKSKEKVVDIEINGEAVDIHMKLGDTGEAFFVEELEEGDEVSSYLGTSPIPNFHHFSPKEDDLRSQDSGVEAEEVISKSLKDKQVKDLKNDLVKVTRGFIETRDVKTGMSFEATVRRSSVVSIDRSRIDLVSELTIKAKPQQSHTEDCSDGTHAASVLLSSSSKSIDGPNLKTWNEDIVRSKSLTSEPPFINASAILMDGQGSKTDVEDTIKINRTSRRRRKKRTNSKKRRIKTTESQSSDNSTTSELVDLSSLSVTGAVSAHDPIFMMEDLDPERVQDTFNLEHQPNFAERTSIKEKHWRRKMSVSLGPDFHPFSDTDISPPPSPGNSRPATPVKSDTEYECEKQKNELSQTAAQSRDTKWSWTWGELPTPPVAPRSKASSRQGQRVDASIDQKCDQIQERNEAEDAQRSMLGNMFSFMRATKKARHNPQSEGIYLDDLNLDELEPEVAALYFPRNSLLLENQNYSAFRSVAKDEDVESGNGTSLPQSPHSVEGAIGGPKLHSVDSDYEDSSRHPIFDYKGYHDLAFSLCGNLHEHLESPFPESLFLQSLVTYDDFCENPDVIDNPHLVVRLDGKYMNWATAASQIVALALFQRPLPKRVIDNIARDNMPKKEIRKRSESKGYSWFSWGRNSGTQTQQQKILNDEDDTNRKHNQQQLQHHELHPQVSASDCRISDGNPNIALSTSSVTTIKLMPPLDVLAPSEISHKVGSPNNTAFVKESLLGPYVTTTTTTTVSSASGSMHVEKIESSKLEKSSTAVEMNDSSESDQEDKTNRKYKKTIRLSSDRIKKLNLRNGSNEVVFSVTTAYQGTTRCKCHIFLWNYDEKIVVSDIDGTITKSDVLGHILPIIGKDWAQGGVAQLFTKIKNNGYNFLYLSARAIGQARITREYLRSIKQGDVSLPDGPLLLNPTSLIHAFHREVIERKPEEFKISCLRDIKALFPSNQNPFYAGYGNRINDVWAYSAVGIPIQRIFTINHRGELKHELTQTFQSSYLNLSDIVNHMFPPSHEREVDDEFSSHQFWRLPLPDLSKEIEETLSK